MGGLATRAQLVAATSRAEVEAALRHRVVVRCSHGRYALPGVDAAAAQAHRVNGHLALTSAALHHGWEVKTVPDRPHVVFPRNRNVPTAWRSEVEPHRNDLGPDDVSGIATGREMTLLQCLRMLPDDEALAVADSALRHGEAATLRRVAAQVRGAGSAKVRRIARAADGRAVNPFESVMRAICLTVPGLSVTPQVVLSTEHYWACPDLVDRERRIVVECDSYAWHGDRRGFLKDVRRHTLLSADTWTVLRFTWDDTMFQPRWVRGVLCRSVDADAQTGPLSGWQAAA